MGASQVPVTYLCDHSFSKSMTACSSGEGCVPVEVRSVSHLAMNVEMTGCRCRVVAYRLVFCSPLECNGVTQVPGVENDGFAASCPNPPWVCGGA